MLPPRLFGEFPCGATATEHSRRGARGKATDGPADGGRWACFWLGWAGLCGPNRFSFLMVRWFWPGDGGRIFGGTCGSGGDSCAGRRGGV